MYQTVRRCDEAMALSAGSDCRLKSALPYLAPLICCLLTCQKFFPVRLPTLDPLPAVAMHSFMTACCRVDETSQEHSPCMQPKKRSIACGSGHATYCMASRPGRVSPLPVVLV